MSNKVGRNDPCPCGSGKKYKRCCLNRGGFQVNYETPQGRVAEMKPLIPHLDVLILDQEGCEGMRKACEFNAQLMDHVRGMIEPGASPKEIDDFVRTFTLDHGHKPACLGYDPGSGPYPASTCISPDHVVCHGIPLIQEPFKEGQIVNVDLTTIVDGWHGDSSETFFVGEVNDLARRLTQCAFDAMWDAIDALRPNCRVSAIGKAITKRAKAEDFSVVEAFTGHGVGREFHNQLAIPHYVTKGSLLTKLPPGITFTIEPMLNAGLKDVVLEGDGWTVTTADRSLSAQHEHTILMTEDGPEVLTLAPSGPRRGHRF